MKPIKIVVVDDHLLLLSGLCMLLNAEPDMEVVGQASSPAEALALVSRTEPDLVLLDITLHGESGLELIRPITSISSATRVVMLTMHEDQQYLRQAMELGASGFVLKKGLDVDLLYAIRSVHRGEVYIQPAMLKSYIAGEDGHPDSSSQEVGNARILWDSLSPREREVMLGVAHGHTSREIAEKNFISEKTVATYRSRAMIKLGLTSRAELVDLVIQLGLLE